jgi:hypothetical protein
MRHIFYSLYSYKSNGKERDFSDSIIDKAAFDFDAENPAELAPVLLKFSDDLLKLNYRHTIVYSGKKGFHIYLFFRNNQKITNNKDALYNFHTEISKEFGVAPDKQLFGDIKRVLRLPNTWHVSGKRFCIPISRQDLKIGYEHIRDKAKKQNFKFSVYGSELFDLTKYDKPRENKFYVQLSEVDYKIDADIDKLFPLCIRAWLLNLPTPEYEESGIYKARYFFAIACRDNGLSQKQCHELAQKYFGAQKRTDNFGNNYGHMKALHVIEQAYAKTDKFVPNCDTLASEGLCPRKCTEYCTKGFPIYK